VFDVSDMKALKANLEKHNYHFTIDSGDTLLWENREEGLRM
jgi:hypothetical protein